MDERTRQDPAADVGTPDEPREASGPAPDWWHRDHPTFTALSGFFTGLVYVALVPPLFAALLGALFDERTAHEAFPFVLLALVVPVGLIAWPRTQRFGKYMLFGVLVTAIVVVGVAWAVSWFMLRESL
jgi:hypothetical protein